MRKWLAGLAAVATALSPIAAVAQGTAGVAVAIPAASGELTGRQKLDLAGPPGPPPGVYRLRNLHSGHCLIFVPTGSANNHANQVPVPVLGHVIFAALSLPFVPSERAHFQQGRCQYTGTGPQDRAIYEDYHYKLSEYWVLPHPLGGVTIRSQQAVGENEREAAPGQITNCATVARGVVIGAPRIDFHACDVEPGRGDWRFAGAQDQRFTLVPKSPGTFIIAVGDGNCWALRNGSRDLGTDVLQWECTGGADQAYTFELVRPLDQRTETALFPVDSWYPTARGYRWIRGAGGVSLSGPAYAQFDTAADNGAYCAKRCAELDQCKAWSWTAPGYVANSGDPPRCYWFDQTPSPVNRGPAEASRVRSGIVRS